jgi:peptide/nickel transport system permease protein
MGSYLVRRFLLMVLTLFGMSVLIFVMLRLVPGNIADILVDASGIATPRRKAKIAHELGIDRPIAEQYGPGSAAWRTAIWASPTSPSGRRSRRSRRASRSAPSSPAWRSSSRCSSACRSGDQRGAAELGLDYFLRVLSLSGLSLPSFWLGLLVLMASVHWFGTSRSTTANRTASCRTSPCSACRPPWSASEVRP